MNRMLDKKGFVFIATLAFILIFAITAGAFINVMMNEMQAVKHQRDSTKAFYLAEAGRNKSIYDLRQGSSGDQTLTSLDGMGQYEVGVSGGTITSTGYFPDKASYNAGQGSKRTVEVEVTIPTPIGFFDNAVTSGQEVDLNGNYVINGNIVYGESFEETGSGTINGTVTQSDGINPLPRLDFQTLRNMAEGQIKGNGENNVYTEQDIKDKKDFPDSFWFRAPGTNDPADPGEPNIVYVETDLRLNGNIGTVGGFFVVVGDVLTNPTNPDVSDTELDGNGTIDGCVYTLGTFNINGGGNGLGVNGGVWSGEETALNGNGTITYNAEYMQAISDLGIDYELQIISWQETPGA